MITANQQIELHFLSIRDGLLPIHMFFVTLTELKFSFHFSTDNRTLSVMFENNIVRCKEHHQFGAFSCLLSVDAAIQ